EFAGGPCAAVSTVHLPEWSFACRRTRRPGMVQMALAVFLPARAQHVLGALVCDPRAKAPADTQHLRGELVVFDGVGDRQAMLELEPEVGGGRRARGGARPGRRARE